jgi:hypothetical protein
MMAAAAPDIALGVSTMSATVGGIVIFGVIFALQELRSFQPDRMNLVESFRTLRERTRLVLLLEVGLLSVSILLLVPLGVMFSMSTGLADPLMLGRIAIAGFSFGIGTQLTALIAYVILERPFMHPATLSPPDADPSP